MCLRWEDLQAPLGKNDPKTFVKQLARRSASIHELMHVPPYAIGPAIELAITMDDTCCRDDLILLRFYSPTDKGAFCNIVMSIVFHPFASWFCRACVTICQRIYSVSMFTWIFPVWKRNDTEQALKNIYRWEIVFGKGKRFCGACGSGDFNVRK